MIADAIEADRSLIKQVIKNMIYKLGLGIRLSVPPERLATISDACQQPHLTSLGLATSFVEGGACQ